MYISRRSSTFLVAFSSTSEGFVKTKRHKVRSGDRTRGVFPPLPSPSSAEAEEQHPLWSPGLLYHPDTRVTESGGEGRKTSLFSVLTSLAHLSTTD